MVLLISFSAISVFVISFGLCMQSLSVREVTCIHYEIISYSNRWIHYGVLLDDGERCWKEVVKSDFLLDHGKKYWYRKGRLFMG